MENPSQNSGNGARDDGSRDDAVRNDGSRDETAHDAASHGDAASDAASDAADAAAERSLSDDIGSLVDEGKAFADAQIAFQKSRLGYSVQNGKAGTIYVFAALGLLHLALIALVVGALLIAQEYLGALWALGIVFGTLFLGIVICGLLIKLHFGRIAAAFKKEDSSKDGAAVKAETAETAETESDPDTD